MATRFQNMSHLSHRPAGYYANNKLFKGSYQRTEWQTRTSRRIHDGFSLTANYGLDTTSDDLNSSPYSSPYYINGRYNSDNLVTQRGNSASVQGNKFLMSYGDRKVDFSDSDIQTTLKLYQGKQIKFELPYSGKIVGSTIRIKNTGMSRGILSIYLSASDGGKVLSEMSVDLCKVSPDVFEEKELRANTVVQENANPRGRLFVRMEMWGDLTCEKQANPFSNTEITDRFIEVSATGLDNHFEAFYDFEDKNLPNTNSLKVEWLRKPSRPLLGLIYNDLSSIPVDRLGTNKDGASVSNDGYRYDIFAVADISSVKMLIYDRHQNIISTPDIKVDGRADHIYIAQVVDTNRNNWVYYVDGYSPLQRFKIGEWRSEVVSSGTPPVIGAKFILFHHNRLYIGGFINDRNLWQCTAIKNNGPDYTEFPYRFYTPGSSPYLNSTSPTTAVIEYEAGTLMFLTKDNFSLFTSNVNLENGSPRLQSSFMDSAGVKSQDDVVNYKGVVYSFNAEEGLRRFTGASWSRLPNSVDSYFARVDMDKPRKLWGHMNKLYFNFVDKTDGKYKCLVWDMNMNYQQYPWFLDTDMPVLDVRTSGTEKISIHADYPAIMEIYKPDTWRRFDTPIVFERHTKYLSVPGNASDMVVKRVHNKVIANENKWWYFALAYDKQKLNQTRGNEDWFLIPSWATEVVEDDSLQPFSDQDIYEDRSTIRLTISNIRIECSSIQEKIRTKTFREQANLISTMFEVQPLDFH